MKHFLLPTAFCLLPTFLPAQALLNRAEAQKTYQQVVNLMEATSIAVPELAGAGGPMIENARQDAKAISGPTFNNSAVLYRFLTSVRVYIELSDAVPKPFPFAEEARKQLAALRENYYRLETHLRALLESKELQLRHPARDNLRRYAEATRSVGPPAAAETRVVFLGDSI